jgi:hypothetical protein
MSITVNAVHRRVQYTGNGSNLGPFSFSFKVLAAGDIKVSEGTTEKTVTTHYTTSLNADGTGSVTFASGNAPANNAIVTIESDQAIERTTDYSTGGDFTAASINDALDRLTINDQQIETLLSRNVQLPATVNRTTSGTGTSGPLFFPYADTASDQASKLISYDSNGTALETTTGRVSSVSVSNVAVSGGASQAATVSFNTTTGALALGIPVGSTGATGSSGSAGSDGVFSAIASQAEAEGGTENTKGMTALRTKQAVDSYGVVTTSDVATTGANKILKLDGSGAISALSGANLTGIGLQGKHEIWVPASAMRPTVSNGCAAITDVETTAGRPDQQVLDFDSSADEAAQWQAALPKMYGNGTISFQVYWTTTGTDTDTCVWGLQAVACSDSDTIDVAYGTAVTVSDSVLSAAEDLHKSAESSALTVGGSVSSGDICFFRIFRDVSADNMEQDARLIGVKLFITTTAGNDA